MKRWRLDAWTGTVIAAAACVLGTCGRAEAGPAGPDLVITDIAPSNTNPPLAGTIDVVVTVLNQGTEDVVDAFDVDLFYNSTVKPTVTDTPDDTKPATVPLAVDETTTVTFTEITNATNETWNMWTYVDRADNVAESANGETNNTTGPVVVTWGLGDQVPDLKITAITPSASPATPGTPITVKVTVVNGSPTSNADSFRLDLFRNLPGPPVIGDTSADNLTALSVPAGSTVDFDFVGIVSAVDATWQMYAIVDTVEAVTEVNENNNIFGPENLVWGTAASLTVDSPNGSEVWDVGTVHNITWTSIGDVGTDVRIEYSPDGGASVWNEIVASTLNDGQYEWTVPNDPSTECLVRVSSTTTSYEDASDAVFTIQVAVVPEPDLKILAIVPSNPNPTVGGTIDVTVTVLNQGDADASFFNVDLFKDRGSPPPIGESEGLKEPVNSLGAGLSTQVVFSGLTSLVVATWSMYAIVDTDAFIDESNEDNNVGGPVLVGWGGGVDAIAVTSPNGAEVLEAGEGHQITWSIAGSPGPPYHIEYSTDGGASWTEIVGLTFNAGSYDWTVPVTASTNCRVLVSNSVGTVSDMSDGVFEIRTTPELVILSVTPSDGHPIAGDGISVDVVVENQGTADAGEFAVALFKNAAAEPSVGDSAHLSETVSSLAAGARTTVSFGPVTSDEAGVWSVYAIADNGEAVAEKDETNNVAGPATVEWHARPWLGSGCASGLAADGGSLSAFPWILPLVAFASALRSRRRRSSADAVKGPGGR